MWFLCADHQGFDSGAESSLLALLLAESRLWDKRESVYSITLAGLRHHIWHHDGLGPRSLSSPRSARPRRDQGPLAEWRRAPPSGAAETHTPQVLHRLLSFDFTSILSQKIPTRCSEHSKPIPYLSANPNFLILSCIILIVSSGWETWRTSSRVCRPHLVLQYRPWNSRWIWQMEQNVWFIWFKLQIPSSYKSSNSNSKQSL